MGSFILFLCFWRRCLLLIILHASAAGSGHAGRWLRWFSARWPFHWSIWWTPLKL